MSTCIPYEISCHQYWEEETGSPCCLPLERIPGLGNSAMKPLGSDASLLNPNLSVPTSDFTGCSVAETDFTLQRCSVGLQTCCQKIR